MELQCLNCNKIFIFLEHAEYKKAVILTSFDYKITFLNSQVENTNSKSDFVLKKRFEKFVLKISDKQNKSDLV